MKHLLTIVFLSIGLFVFANNEPGDTVFVKTFTFDSISNRRAIFEFPAEQEWEKVLMYYTLKCDAATPWDSYPCGEWDYTTYTNVYEHTGNLDSTQYLHPEYTLNNQGFETFNGSNTPKFHKYEIEYTQSTYNFTSSAEHWTGSPETQVAIGITPGENDSKTFLLYQAGDLTTVGVSAGDLTSIKFSTTYTDAFSFPVVLKVAETDITTISRDDVADMDFQELYVGLLNYDGSNIIEIEFDSPFNWDGLTNLVFEIDLPNNTNVIELSSEDLGYSTVLCSNAKDYFLDFENYSYVEAPSSSFSALSDQVTVCCWAYGDPDIQAQNDYLFEAYGADGERQMCVHYPWSNGSIYWDCGNDGTGYDRINLAATESEYKGKWNHLAFVKNATNGSMKIYINGELWHSGTEKTKNIENITRFIIGSAGSPTSDRSYDGYIDDFNVWNVELTEEQIQGLMYDRLDASHELYSNLIAYYDFDETPGSGNVILDKSSNNANAYFLGDMNRKSYNGSNRFKLFDEYTTIPETCFEQGEFTYETNTLTYVDSILMNQQIIMQYENVDFYSVQCIDTTFYYPNYSLFTHADMTTDTTFVAEDVSITNTDLVYYGEAFEVINTIQIQNFVTPYGINLNLGSDGFSWVYEVTDYQKYLHDDVDILSHNTQELLDLTFVFIEGTPVRNVLSFDQVYLGDFGHANIANDISMTPTKLKRNLDAEMYTVKTRTTGHGMAGSGNCAEFCPTYHNISVEGEQRYEWYNWTECSTNPVYPQGGTWIFDRAGWCPGAFADTYDWDITEFVTDSDSIEIDYGMTQYQVGSGEGNYRVSVQLIQYGAPNFANNAAIEDVLAPNDHDLHNRYNPVCNNPRILIKNNGSETLSSVNVEYGINGDYSYTHQWTGELEFLETEEIALPVINWQEFVEENTFNVRLVNPNTVEDEYSYDNHFETSFDAVDIWTETIMLVVRTNNYGSETHYQVLDQSGNILVDRNGLDSNTTYYDTLDYDPGCYEIKLYDNGEDGLRFWYNLSTAGSGYMKLRLPGSIYVKDFDSDFGSFINYQFVYPDLTYIQNQELNRKYFDIYPNPNEGVFDISLNFDLEQKTQISVFDMYGKKVYELSGAQITQNELNVDLSELSKGVYFVNVQSGKINRTSKLVIK